MSFDEVRLPVEVERGAAGGPGFLTVVNVLASGKEQRNQNWEDARGKWTIGYGIQERADALAVRDFFMARRGRARGFRFRDWSDYQTGDTENPVDEQADGSETVFLLKRRYIDSGGFFYERRIFKPVAATVKVYVDGVEQASGWTLDATTGTVTFTVAPDYGVDVTWTGDYDLPVRFDTDTLEAIITTREVISFPALPLVELKL